MSVLNKYRAILFFTIVLTAICIGCHSTRNLQVTTENPQTEVRTFLNEFGLNGKVKEIVVSESTNYPLKERSKYGLMNDMKAFGVGYYLIDSLGFKVTEILRDTTVEAFRSGDLKELVPFRKRMKNFYFDTIPSNVESKYSRDVNYILDSDLSIRVDEHYYLPMDLILGNDSATAKIITNYTHRFDSSGALIKEMFFLGDREKLRLGFEEAVIAKEFSYDENHHVLNVKYTFPQRSRRLEMVKNGEIDYVRKNNHYFRNGRISVPPDYNYNQKYTYDANGNIKSMTFYRENLEEPNRLVKSGENQYLWKETYTYDKKNSLVKIDRFIDRDILFLYYCTENSTVYLNKHGNVSEVVLYNEDGTEHSKRFYRYKYDKHDNWTHCDCYLDGVMKKVPEKVWDREIYYYDE